MIIDTIGPEVVVLRDRLERCVLFCGERYTTAVDLPTRLESLSAILNTSRDLTPEGLRVAILTHEPEGIARNLQLLQGVQLMRADRTPSEDWEWDDVPPDMLALPDVPVHIVRQPQTLYDDTGRAFHVEPCLGSSAALSVFVEPESMLICCEDLDTVLPPRIRPGRVHETLMRLEDWRLRAPTVLVPASGVPIGGDAVIEMLDRCIAYVRALYHQTRVGLTETRVPWERLVYMIPVNKVWHVEEAARPVMDRHRENVHQMAEDIFQRVQGEAEEISFA
jgi:hypothetical protein